MKKYNKTLIMASAFYTLMFADLFASNVQVVNSTDDTINLYFRGQGNNQKPHIEALIPGATKTYVITDAHINGQPLFEVVASTGSVDSPVSGVCRDLTKDGDHTIKIEKTKLGLKTSCTQIQ